MGEALAAVEAGLAFVARADAASVPVEALGDGLRSLERAESASTAARSKVLRAFIAQAGPEADGCLSAKAWLASQTRVTRGAASGALGWMRRLSAHPRVARALAGSEITASWARKVCEWSDRLPEDLRDEADQILLAAVAGGADLADLAGLAEEMSRRCAPPDSDDDDGGFTDRSVHLDLHYQGEGKLGGDLTATCAAALDAVLESLGKKAGPEDDRSLPQRRHDALEEACRRLAGTGCLPAQDDAPSSGHLVALLRRRAVRAGRARRFPAHQPADRRLPPGHEPGPGHRRRHQRHSPAPAARRHSPGPALPISRLPSARQRMPSAPSDSQVQRRPHRTDQSAITVRISPSDRDSPGGWSITLHGDGTTTAVSPDGQRVLHSHSPPAAVA